MVVKIETITERLKYLDTVLQELSKYQTIKLDVFYKDLSQQWIIERGLIAAAAVIFDIADHILSGHFAYYANSYQDSLLVLQEKEVISNNLYQALKGLGGFRNILVHRYLDIDPQETFEGFQKALIQFPLFAQEILEWLDIIDNIAE